MISERLTKLHDSEFVKINESKNLINELTCVLLILLSFTNTYIWTVTLQTVFTFSKVEDKYSKNFIKFRCSLN